MGLFGKKKGLVGLDIGSSAVKAVELKAGGKGAEFQLVNIGIEALPPEAIVDGAIMDSGAVIDAIQRIFASQKIKTADVATSVSGNAVIVGRGGAFILKDDLRALHVHTYAALPCRIETAMRQEGLDRATAERRIHDTDRERARYIKNLFKAEWEALRHYHLLLDSGRLGIATCVDLIVEAAQRLG